MAWKIDKGNERYFNAIGKNDNYIDCFIHGSGKWFMIIQYKRIFYEGNFFETKKEALAYAKKWMKAHPNG